MLIFLSSVGHSLKGHCQMAIFGVKMSHLSLPILDTVSLCLKRREELIMVFQTQIRRYQLVKVTYHIPGLLKLFNACHSLLRFISLFGKPMVYPICIHSS